MKRIQILVFFLVSLCAVGIASAQTASSPLNNTALRTTLRVLVHNSFSLPKPLLAQFEADSGIKLSIIKAGDAAEMLNKLILTRAAPIADVVYGIDNSLQFKAQKAGVLDYYAGPARQKQSAYALGASILPVNVGYVTINLDKAGFAKTGLPVPKTLHELTLPAYKGLLAVQNPATSSTGHAFLLATVAGLGETAAFEWWAKMRANGLKVAKGWSEAYYTDFSRNGGAHPFVVSYASSPAAEVFYSKVKLTQAPTQSLSLKGAVFQQIEGAALIKGGSNVEAASQFLEFLRSSAVQTALQTTMWMQPVESKIPADPVFAFAPEPSQHFTPTSIDIEAKSAEWVTRWTKAVLK